MAEIPSLRDRRGDLICPRCRRRLIIPKLRRDRRGRPAARQPAPWCASGCYRDDPEPTDA